MAFAPLLRSVPDASPGVAGQLDGGSVLVPLLTDDVSAVTDQVRVATTLARSNGGTVHAIHPSDGESSDYRLRVSDEPDRNLLEWARTQVSASPPDLAGRVRTARGLTKALLGALESSDFDTLVVPGDCPTGLLGGRVDDRLASRVDCDVVTVNGKGGYDDVASILLPVAGGPHSGLAADVARRVAVECDAWVDVLCVVDPAATDERREAVESLVDAVSRRIGRPETTTEWVLEAEESTEAIIEQSAYYGLTVVGAPTKGRLRRFVSGSTNQSIRENARSVVLSARNGKQRP